jgi:hypothetical protein
MVEKSAPSLMSFRGGVLGPIEGENMRIAFNIVGAVLVFFGGVWVLQGVNVLPGSFMSGQMRWAVRGGIAPSLAQRSPQVGTPDGRGSVFRPSS